MKLFGKSWLMLPESRPPHAESKWTVIGPEKMFIEPEMKFIEKKFSKDPIREVFSAEA